MFYDPWFDFIGFICILEYRDRYFPPCTKLECQTFLIVGDPPSKNS